MSEISPDGHDEMPFRLGDVILEKKFADLHPMLSTIDQIRHEWKFQFKLLRHEWGQPHLDDNAYRSFRIPSGFSIC